MKRLFLIAVTAVLLGGAGTVSAKPMHQHTAAAKSRHMHGRHHAKCCHGHMMHHAHGGMHGMSDMKDMKGMGGEHKMGDGMMAPAPAPSPAPSPKP